MASRVDDARRAGASQAAQTLGLKKQAFLGTVAGGLSRAINPMMVAGSGYQGAAENKANPFRGAAVGATQTLGGLAAGQAGASAGAALGTMILPGIGTTIGGILGGIGGYMGAGKYLDPLVNKYMPGQRAMPTFRPQTPGLPRVGGMG